MMQIFFLRISYLVFTSLLYLVEVMRAEIPFMLRVRRYIGERRSLRIFFFVSGIVLGVISLVHPVEPGPMILGDFIPSAGLLLSSLYFHQKEEREVDVVFESYFESGNFKRGIALMAIAILDFLFPRLILL